MKEPVFKVAETFVSINGEAQTAGELALFIRFCRCNLQCTYCDTRWANGEDAPCTEYTLSGLLELAKKADIRNITLTGGEPLLREGIGMLAEALGSEGFRVEIETNGSISIAELAVLPHRPCFTLDYKLPTSGMESFMDTENYQYLTMQDTVKFVCGSPEDLERAEEITAQYHLTGQCRVYLSPVFGKITPAEMVEYMKSHHMNGIRLQLQLHKYIWDPAAKGV